MKALENIKWLEDVFVTRKEENNFEVNILIKDAFREAIEELESLNNRSCENCKHHIDTSKLSDEEYLSLIDQCTRCKHYYNDNWEPK